ncbi:MAG: ABC transporter ATP-binding protein [Spirochaetales bacterium]|nr:ABC transporter ATP-binding protein [Spirochaetales bacterium]
MADLLKVEGLRTSFATQDGRIEAVKGVDFSLNQGETLGIVGESGSGKSVTSLSILRLLPSAGQISGGRVLFGGQDLASFDEKAMRQVRGAQISMIFQDPMSSLNPLIPVGKQVEEMLQIHWKTEKAAMKKRVLHLFERVRIPDPAARYRCYPHEFSGGMRQRVMIAMALACEPSLLIADEPTTALDVTVQDQILVLLRELRQETGMAVMMISHDLGVIAEVCDRVLVMYGGMVMESAPIDALFENPMHPYTLGLMESIPALDQDRSKELQPIPGSPPDMSNPPKGCPFHPRCLHARSICAQQIPSSFAFEEGRTSRCWLLHPDAPSTSNPLKKGVSHGV